MTFEEQSDRTFTETEHGLRQAVPYQYHFHPANYRTERPAIDTMQCPRNRLASRRIWYDPSIAPSSRFVQTQDRSVHVSACIITSVYSHSDLRSVN